MRRPAPLPTPEEVEERVRAGHWPTVREAAVLLGVDKTTVNRWTRDPDGLRFRLHGKVAKVLHPEDVLRKLAEQRAIRGPEPDQAG